jgi:hypothetical protein
MKNLQKNVQILLLQEQLKGIIILKEYHEDNNKEYTKEYYEDNKEKIAEKKKNILKIIKKS